MMHKESGKKINQNYVYYHTRTLEINPHKVMQLYKKFSLHSNTKKPSWKLDCSELDHAESSIHSSKAGSGQANNEHCGYFSGYG